MIRIAICDDTESDIEQIKIHIIRYATNEALKVSVKAFTKKEDILFALDHYELLELAKANGVEITEDDAKRYFAQLSPKYGEIDDDELDNVAGGACYAGDGRMVVTVGYVCANIYGCPHCKKASIRIDDLGCVYCNKCNRQLTCKDCNYMSYEGGMWLCNHEANRG